MLKSAVLVIFMLLACISTSAQEFEKDDVTVLYKNEIAGGVSFHTTGLGLELKRAYHKTGYSKLLWTVQLYRIKHPREVKSVNPIYDTQKSFVYGKNYSMGTLRLGGGYQKVLTNKSKKGNIEIKYVLQTGASIALLKPNYLEVLFVPNPNFPEDLSTRLEMFDISKHNAFNIYSRAPFNVGLNESLIRPGAFFKAGFNFEYGYDHDDLRALEAGIMVDAFPMVLPLMASESNSRFYVNLYVSFLYGRKWY